MNGTEEILDRSELMLKAAYRGLKQYQESEREDKIIGLYNVATFGRSVTFVLQKMKGESDRFEGWYTERVEVLEDDPVCSFMNELRNKILKEGDAGFTNYTKVNNFSPAQIQRKMPPWADGAFIGDQFGGSGFYIESPDGDQEKFYYDFEFDNVETGLYFEETQDSNTLYDPDITQIGDDLTYYVSILAELVADAKAEFGNVESDD